MSKLNLVEEGNGVLYTITTHKDSQISFKIDQERMRNRGYDLTTPESCEIRSRMNSYTDLYIIKAATQALRSWGVKTINLFVSCFFGQRSDREFGTGESFDLWEICQDIQAQGYHTKTIFHPHSDVLPALLYSRYGKVVIMPHKPYVQIALADIIAKYGAQDVVIVSPDAGAYKWVYKLGGELGIQVVTGNKCRFGEDLHVDIHGDVNNKICLVLDDYLDGGRTFTELAKPLRAQGATKVYLYISHGLFSYGITDEMRQLLDGIYTTNSINDDQDDFVTKFKII